MSGALNMGTKLINNVATPSAATDAATKSYVDSQDALKLSLAGGTMSGALNMGTKLINNVATPSAATDAATKAYVDTTAAGYVPLTSGTLTNATLAGATSALTGTLTCSGAGKITGVPTPSAASDAVPKSYADLLVAGLTFKPAVACYTTLAAPFNTFVYNGGQQITINVVSTPIDGYTLQLNDRVLVNCAGTQAANGVYLVTQLASPITFVRPADLDGSPLSEFQQGGLFYVTNGTIYGGSLFVQSSAPPAVLGTSPIVYSQYSAAKNISAGANVAITGNSVAVTPALSGITGVGLNAGDGSAGVLTVGKASGAASYTLALPSAAPASNTFLKYDGANYAWSVAGSPLTGGTNINITSNSVGLNTAVSGLTSLAINGTSTIDAITLSKASGGAAYTLALPATAPTASTYLKYDGTNYAWASAGSALTAFTGATSGANGTLGGVPAPQAGDQLKYLQANGTWSAVSGSGAVAAQYVHATTDVNVYVVSNNNETIATNWYFPFNIVNNVSSLITTPSIPAPFSSVITEPSIPAPSTFTLAAGYTYKCTFEVGYANNQVIYGWYNITTLKQIGSWASLTIPGNVMHNTALAYITTTTTPVTIGVAFAWGNGVNCPRFYNASNAPVVSFATIEVVSSNNAIMAFAGATSAADGAIGYIPKPLAGQDKYVLNGGGGWSKLGLGLTGEIWNNVKDLRPKNTPQTNKFAYPIAISVAIGNNDGGRYASLWVGGIKVAYNEGGNTSTFYAVIPPGQTYEIFGGDSVDTWAELY